MGARARAHRARLPARRARGPDAASRRPARKPSGRGGVSRRCQQRRCGAAARVRAGERTRTEARARARVANRERIAGVFFAAVVACGVYQRLHAVPDVGVFRLVEPVVVGVRVGPRPRGRLHDAHVRCCELDGATGRGRRNRGRHAAGTDAAVHLVRAVLTSACHRQGAVSAEAAAEQPATGPGPQRVGEGGDARGGPRIAQRLLGLLRRHVRIEPCAGHLQPPHVHRGDVAGAFERQPQGAAGR
mmetsp:Transcript_54656/g.168319  ORF Transcript_54656/g.168319 Transcript_54656/m.168319 type:complete len:245 (+) Transcript_54656:306-1040(+)